MIDSIAAKDIDALERVGDELRRLFVAAPQYRDWLASVQKPTDTFDAWCKMLVKVSPKHLHEAVNRILEGELEMPKGYARDELPLMLRSYAGRIADDERRENAIRYKEEQRRQMREARDARGGTRYKYRMPDLYSQGLKLRARLESGEITPDDYRVLIAEVNSKARELA